MGSKVLCNIPLLLERVRMLQILEIICPIKIQFEISRILKLLFRKLSAWATICVIYSLDYPQFWQRNGKLFCWPKSSTKFTFLFHYLFEILSIIWLKLPYILVLDKSWSNHFISTFKKNNICCLKWPFLLIFSTFSPKSD